MSKAIRYTQRGFSAFERTGKLQPKIDVSEQHRGPDGKTYWTYAHSTNWHARCCDAVAAANREHPGRTFRAQFDKNR